MYNIAICDDNEFICSNIKKLILDNVGRFPHLININVFHSGSKIEKYLKEGNDIDLLFLDIELGKINGVEVGRFIRKELKNDVMHIAYISANSSYAMELFENKPINFLLKPLSGTQLLACIDEAIRMSNKYKVGMKIHNKNGMIYVPFYTVYSISSFNKKVTIKTIDGEIEFHGKLVDVLDKAEGVFLQIHKSHAINPRYVKLYKYNEVLLLNEDTFSVSQAFRKKVKEHLFNEENYGS